MTKDNFIVITGGPGSGKSAILHFLSRLGYKYINETGRGIIKDRISRGLTPRPSPGEFANQMFRSDYKNYIDNLETSGTVFFDRSFLDSASLIAETDKAQTSEVKEILETYRFNKNVFIAPPWEEIYCTDNERDQTYEESIVIYERLYKWYTLNGYDLIEFPKSDVDRRVKFLLEKIGQPLQQGETPR